MYRFTHSRALRFSRFIVSLRGVSLRGSFVRLRVAFMFARDEREIYLYDVTARERAAEAHNIFRVGFNYEMAR